MTKRQSKSGTAANRSGKSIKRKSKKTARCIQPILETLEIRQLLSTGSVTGTVFNDINGNGAQNSGEAGIAGITVYADVANMGSFKTGDPSATTNSSGAYTLTGVPTGATVVRQILPSGETQDFPTNGFGDHVTVSANKTSSGANFGDKGSATPLTSVGSFVSGTIYSDANGNGKQDSGETGLAGITVYDDANNNGILDSNEVSAATNSSGVYTLTGVPTGAGIIRAIVPGGDKQTSPANGLGNHVTITANQGLSNINFGIEGSSTTVVTTSSGASVSGTVFNDANGNGKQDSGETGISGVTIYNDANNDGVLDNGEASTTTNSSGAYTLGGLPAGAALIRQILPSGDKQTSPSNGFGNHATLTKGQVVTSTNFGDQTTASPTSTPAPPVVSGSWATYSASRSSDGSAPQAVLQLLAPVKMVGIAIVVQGNSSSLGSGSPITTNYQWNFGDPGGQYNTLPGYNASHVYNNPGTYTITLTITNQLHKASTVSAQITIAGDSRKIIYVDSVHGSDSNNGSSPSQALKTAAKADTVLRSNTEVLFDRGEEFNMTSTFLTPYSNVVIGAYGSGANPIMNWNTSAVGVMFSNSTGTSIGVTFENLTMDTLNHTTPGSASLPQAIVTRGTNIDINNVTFLDVDYDINANSTPTGLMITNCSSPLSNGLYAYFLWDQAIDSVVLGNTVVNSIHEHIIRSSGASGILVDDNNFTNNDGKGCIEIHEGSYAWIQDNTVTNGDIRVGPLGLWDEPVTDITQYAVIQGNTVNNVSINVDPGSEDIAIMNNIIYRNTGMMIDVRSTDSMGHTSGDIRILNNTGISTGTNGNFLKVETHTYGIVLANNLMVAPNLVTGVNGSAPVYDYENNLTSFTYIGGNIWPMPTQIYNLAAGGVNFSGTTFATAGYYTPAAWNAASMIATDIFSDVPVNSSGAPSSSGGAANADTYVDGAFYDFNNKPIAASGAISAGAIQV